MKILNGRDSPRFYTPHTPHIKHSPPVFSPGTEHQDLSNKYEHEINALKDEVTFIERELDAINKRIEELESAPSNG